VATSESNYTTSVIKQWGTSGDVPANGDYTGDGKEEFAVWRPSDGNWYWLTSESNWTTSSTHGPLGMNNDIYYG
jgi:hypothetical protein